MSQMRLCCPRRVAGLALGLTLACVVQASPADPLEAARECAEETSRLERLGCYDALFRDDATDAEAEVGLPALWHAIAAQEARRESDDVGLLVGEEGDDVLLSAPALGTLPPRPLLVIACEKAITRFQLHLPEALDASRVELRLMADGRELAQTWRVRDGGHVVSGGRGLPAIETLGRLMDAETLVLGSDLAALDGLRFDIGELRQRIQPLRDACRW